MGQYVITCVLPLLELGDCKGEVRQRRVDKPDCGEMKNTCKYVYLLVGSTTNQHHIDDRSSTLSVYRHLRHRDGSRKISDCGQTTVLRLEYGTNKMELRVQEARSGT